MRQNRGTQRELREQIALSRCDKPKHLGERRQRPRHDQRLVGDLQRHDRRLLAGERRHDPSRRRHRRAFAVANAVSQNSGQDTLITLQDSSTMLLKGIAHIDPSFFS